MGIDVFFSKLHVRYYIYIYQQFIHFTLKKKIVKYIIEIGWVAVGSKVI